MTDPVAAYSHLQPTAPAAPTLAHLCRLYGKMLDMSARPVPFRAFYAWFHPVTDSPVLSDAVLHGDAPVQAVTDRNGDFYLDVPQGARIVVQVPGSRSIYPMAVPRVAVAPLFSHLFPHPVLLTWCEAVLDDDFSAEVLDFLLDVDGSPINEIEVPINTDFYFGLCAEYSDGTLCRLLNINYEVLEEGGPDITVTRPDAHTVCVRRSSVGDVTLRSLEEESLTGEETLWEAAGYSAQNPPLFLPTEAHELNDAEDLIIHFV